MIQRIQTLYLFIAGITSTLGAFFLPMYSVNSEQFKATAAPSTFGLFGLGMALFSGAIMLYSNRKIQLFIVRMGMLASLLTLGAILLKIKEIEGASASWGSIAPFVMILSAFMASKAIQKDENKVRSLDRLR